jgi:glyoxylase-like metal-dependent hydrolase (beta-lactamase superfamily II)
VAGKRKGEERRVEEMAQEIIIRQIPIGDFEVFTYVVACPETREAIIMDPAGEPEKILSAFSAEDLKPRFILNTHGHADHILGNEALKEALAVPVCLHRADMDFFCSPAIKERIEKELGLACEAVADIPLEDGQTLTLGNLEIKVIHTPGHTPGSCCFLTEGNLFTGDTLVVGAAGRTDLTGGSLDTLLASIRDKLLVLPTDTVIWPGHDYGDSPTSTIGREMEENVYITEFILDE